MTGDDSNRFNVIAEVSITFAVFFIVIVCIILCVCLCCCAEKITASQHSTSQHSTSQQGCSQVSEGKIKAIVIVEQD